MEKTNLESKLSNEFVNLRGKAKGHFDIVLFSSCLSRALLTPFSLSLSHSNNLAFVKNVGSINGKKSDQRNTKMIRSESNIFFFVCYSVDFKMRFSTQTQTH